MTNYGTKYDIVFNISQTTQIDDKPSFFKQKHVSKHIIISRLKIFRSLEVVANKAQIADKKLRQEVFEEVNCKLKNFKFNSVLGLSELKITTSSPKSFQYPFQ